MYENTFSAADIAAVTRNNDGNGMFGNDWAWIIILLLFGYGGRGFGGFYKLFNRFAAQLRCCGTKQKHLIAL